ncbi:HxlR family transcriptional regulator [Frankia sp. R43]|uniref:winged helix-turn-helix transcriptional regulator n=1 Tax=Frankia sp. R43 TaxID=269536 RepID=UPI0006CA0DDE|nr:helix-turn-helix domain-containing protein [Frankia sp. R43]KPM53407.1 HxlR family transcriptional regulator [Frankia sp. R43]
MSVRNTAVTTSGVNQAELGPCGDDDCGIRDVLDRIGDKWSVLVVVELSKGVRRFRELQRAIPGISQRMLTLTTRRLCRDGIVHRTVYATVPAQVDYRLTPVGESLVAAIFALADWSREHRDAIAAARRSWDELHGDVSATTGRSVAEDPNQTGCCSV